ncbi:unnamed protein product, partial [Symbiodinium sp. KB8]
MVVLTCQFRWWLAVGSLATAIAFKVAEAPMEIVRTDNETLKKEVEGIAAKNMEAEFKEMNDIPNPANFTLNGSMPNASQGVWADQRVGELGKSFEFMMLKLAQLETLCELQQAELETLRKTVKGLAEHVDHPDSVASLVQKDEKARMQETQQTLKRVLAKHARQHKNKDFHPKASRQNYRPADAKPESPKHAGEAGASDRAELLAEGAQQSGSKGSQRFDPVHWAKHRYEDVHSVAESAADAYEAAPDKVAFIANTEIDTVEMAVAIFLRGFSDWRADCEIRGPSIRDYMTECYPTHREIHFGAYSYSIPWLECRNRSVLMALNWGRQKCKISLMGQERAQTERDLHGVVPGQRLAPSSRQTSSNTRHGTVFGRPSLRLFGKITTTYAPDGASTSRWSFFFGEKRAVLSLTGWSGRLAEGDGIRSAWCAGAFLGLPRWTMMQDLAMRLAKRQWLWVQLVNSKATRRQNGDGGQFFLPGEPIMQQ